MKRKSSNIKVKSNIEDKEIIGILKNEKPINKIKNPKKSKKLEEVKESKEVKEIKERKNVEKLKKLKKIKKSVKFTPGTKEGNIMLENDIISLFSLKYHKFTLNKKVVNKINELLSNVCNKLIKYSIISIDIFETKNILSNLNIILCLNILSQKSKNNMFYIFQKEIKRIEKTEKNQTNEKNDNLKYFSLIKIKKYAKSMTNNRISEDYIISLSHILNYFCNFLFKLIVIGKKMRLEKKSENETLKNNIDKKITKIDIDYEVKEIDFNFGIRQDLEIKNFIKYLLI